MMSQENRTHQCHRQTDRHVQ